MKPQNYFQLIISNITKLWEFSLQFYAITEGKKALNFNSPHKVLIQDFTSDLLLLLFASSTIQYQTPNLAQALQLWRLPVCLLHVHC